MANREASCDNWQQANKCTIIDYKCHNKSYGKVFLCLFLDRKYPCVCFRVSHCTPPRYKLIRQLCDTQSQEKVNILRHIVIRIGRRGHVGCHNKYEKWHCDGAGSMGPSKDQSYAKWTHLMVIYYHTSRSENKNNNISFSSFSFYHPLSCVDIFGDKVD